MNVPGSGWRRVLDLMRQVGGTTYISGHGARHYLDHQAFENNGVTVTYMNYAAHPWLQPHGPFTPYVTGLDLITNVAPDRPSQPINHTLA